MPIRLFALCPTSHRLQQACHRCLDWSLSIPFSAHPYPTPSESTLHSWQVRQIFLYGPLCHTLCSFRNFRCEVWNRWFSKEAPSLPIRVYRDVSRVRLQERTSPTQRDRSLTPNFEITFGVKTLGIWSDRKIKIVAFVKTPRKRACVVIFLAMNPFQKNLPS